GLPHQPAAPRGRDHAPARVPAPPARELGRRVPPRSAQLPAPLHRPRAHRRLMEWALPDRAVWPYPGRVAQSHREGNPECMGVSAPTPLLRLGCGARCGRSGAGGHLVIEPGAARFEFHASMVKLGLPPVIHAHPPLIFMRARLLPPGFSSGLILDGDEGTVTVFTWCGLRSRVRRALEEAEVAFIVRATWLSIGVTEGAGERARLPGAP